jgi:serine protease Do
MNMRTRTIASFFTVAMAAMLLGAVVTTQIHPGTAMARPADPLMAAAATAAVPRPQGPLTLDTFRDVARLQTNGVVNINTKKIIRNRGQRNDQFRDFFGDDFMERFFGPQGQGGGGNERPRTQQSLGSGFIVDKSGYILTNRHVIEGADEITVSIGRKDYVAKLVGKDARTDVALLKIDAPSDLTVLNLGDSDLTEPGEWVMAIGNPFGLGGNSVTVGVVSYKGRNMQLQSGTGVDMIQTDASINPGNSGGPLLNTRGEVIGINTLIITQGLPQSAGVGFAVPINAAKEILPQLREHGKVVRGWLGVQIIPLTEDLARTYKRADAKGAAITDVTDASPAEKAGLKPGDVVIGVDGRSVNDNNDLSRYIASKAPGETVRLQIVREGGDRTVPVTLGTFPEQGAEDAEDSQQTGKAELGMTLRNLTPDMAEHLEMPRTAKGVVVTDVEAGDNAEDAGLQRGDVIVSVNGVNVDDVEAFRAAIDRARPEGLARLRVRRGRTHTFLVLKLK